MSRLAIVAALEALEELDDRSPVGAGRRPGCPHCGLTFEWPGLLDRHLAVVHDGAVAA